MSLVIFTILPQFLLILLGTGLKKFLNFPPIFWSSLEALVFYVLFPPLLFLSVAKSQINFESCANFLSVSIGCMLCAVLSSWLINQFYKESAWTKWSVFHCGFRFNTYIGFAICQPLFGNEGFALLSLLIAIWVPISNTIAVIGLSYASGAESKFSAFKLLKQVISNPLIIATVLGLFFNVYQLTLPQFLETFLSSLGKSSLALGLLCIGASLAFEDFKRYRNLIFWCSAQRLIIVPALAVGISCLLMDSNLDSSVLILFAALPTAQSCYVMTSKMKGNGAAVADLTSFQTLVSMLTLSLWLIYALPIL